MSQMKLVGAKANQIRAGLRFTTAIIQKSTYKSRHERSNPIFIISGRFTNGAKAFVGGHGCSQIEGDIQDRWAFGGRTAISKQAIDEVENWTDVQLSCSKEGWKCQLSKACISRSMNFRWVEKAELMISEYGYR